MRAAMAMSLLCCALLTAGAEEKCVVKGRVRDGERRTPIGGAHVLIVGSSIAGQTGPDGAFSLPVGRSGSATLRVTHVGFAPVERSLLLAPGDTIVCDVLLSPVPVQGLPITVTATRGVERETPATFATISAEELRERYTVQELPVLLSDLPSSTYYSESGNGIGYAYLTLRGFDARRVALMINGIPQNDPEDHNVYWLDFPDIAASLEDVQVQRGAGSAFYGSPAIGGSVNLVTRALGRERSVEASAGIGSYGTRRYSLSIGSGMLGGRYALYGRYSRLLSDGYRKKSWVKYTGYFLGIVRYDETMTTQLHLYGGPISDGLAYYGIPKGDVSDRGRRRDNPIARPEELENFHQPHAELLHEWRPSADVTVNNTFFAVLGDGFFDYDGSWAPLSYFRLTPAYGIPVTGDPERTTIPDALIHAAVRNRQFGWLPRLTLTHGNGTTILGAEIRTHRSLHWGELKRTPGLPAVVPDGYRYYEYRGGKEIISFYAHTLFDASTGVKVMADLQYSYNRYRLYAEKFVGTEFAVPYYFLNPRLGVNINLDERWNAYLHGAYTSREPRLKNLYDAAESSTPEEWGRVAPQFFPAPLGGLDFTRPLVRPESLLDWELGVGVNDGPLRAGLNLYWMEFSDEIVKSGRVDRFGQPVTGNADRTRHLGVEVSAQAPAGRGFEFAGAASVSRNRFIRHTDYSTGTPLPLDGNPIAGFPDLLANVRFTYRTGGLALILSGRFLGRQYTDNFRSEENSVDPHAVWDAAALYTLTGLPGGGAIEAKLHVNNLFDALYAAYGESTQFFVGAERNVFFNLTARF